MVIMVQETEMKYMYGTGAIYFYMNEEEPYCFTDEEVPFFGWNLCYADLNGDGNVEIAIALVGTRNCRVDDIINAGSAGCVTRIAMQFLQK